MALLALAARKLALKRCSRQILERYYIEQVSQDSSGTCKEGSIVLALVERH